MNEIDVLTRVGPGPPVGELVRQYWIPAAMSSELRADGPPMRLRLLGEDLFAFRTSSGKVGVMDQRCPHRCVSLFYGRNEEDGIRCVFHGWNSGIEGLDCQDAAVQESMGEIVDRSFENLVASDLAVARTRRRLLNAVKALQEGTVPPGVDQPDVYQAWSGYITAPSDMDWRRVYAENVPKVVTA